MEAATGRLPRTISRLLLRCPFSGLGRCGFHLGVPAAESIAQLVIQHTGPHLEQKVRPALAPPHLLHPALANHLVYCRFHSVVAKRLQLSRGTGQHRPPAWAPIAGDAALAASSPSPQSAASRELGARARTGRALAPRTALPASLPQRAL